MKEEILAKLAELESRLRALLREVRGLPIDRVSRKALRGEAAALAELWVEDVRAPLEHRFKLPPETIEAYATGFCRLDILSRPNNRRTSYETTLGELLRKFKDRLVLPVRQAPGAAATVTQLGAMVRQALSGAESDYLLEAVECVERHLLRAGVVMAWCAVVDTLRTAAQDAGLPAFNRSSAAMKVQAKGRFKRFNKEFRLSTESELQQVFDTDLIRVMEHMGFFDANQADRLIGVCYQLRCQSAHPGAAPVKEANIVAYFSDILDIVLGNPKFARKPAKPRIASRARQQAPTS